MRALQLVPSIIMGDAMSNHILEIHARLQAWGYESLIFASTIGPELRNIVQPESNLKPYLHEKEDLLIYHYGIYHPNAQLFQTATCRRILVYHNITPSRFFAGWNPLAQQRCQSGRFMLSYFSDCDLGLGVSAFNQSELLQAGFVKDKTGILPIFLRLSYFESLQSDKNLLVKLGRQYKKKWIVVGTVYPHKGIDDAIRIFSVYNRFINPNSHLYIIGANHLESYVQALQTLINELEIGENVTFTGHIPDSQLKTYYEAADIYLTASYHEGFCVPLIESMYFGVPILARKAAAIPETLGESGILFNHPGYDEIAQMAHLVISDQELQARIIQKQYDQLETLSPAYAEIALQNALARLGLPNGR